MKNACPLLKGEGDLVTKYVEKDTALNAFLILVFTGKDLPSVIPGS